jgi:hypothetical protein
MMVMMIASTPSEKASSLDVGMGGRLVNQPLAPSGKLVEDEPAVEVSATVGTLPGRSRSGSSVCPVASCVPDLG